MKRFVLAALGAATLFSATTEASATVFFGTGTISGTENVLFGSSGYSFPSRVARTASTDVAVTFSSPTGIYANASGQSSATNFYSLAALQSTLIYQISYVIDPGYYFTGTSFNLPGVAGNAPPIEASSVLVEALGLNGSVLGSHSFALNGNGANRFNVTGDAGEQFGGIRLTLNPFYGVVDSLRQVRVAGVAAVPVTSVPEPQTWGLMILGIGATGFAMRRRPRSRAKAA